MLELDVLFERLKNAEITVLRVSATLQTISEKDSVEDMWKTIEKIRELIEPQVLLIRAIISKTATEANKT